MLKRGLSLLLSITIILSLLLTPSFASVNVGDNAGGSGAIGGEGTGTMDTGFSGYRMYLIRKEGGQRVTEPIDILYKNPTEFKDANGNYTSYAEICFGTKIDGDLGYQNSLSGGNAIYTMSRIKQEAGLVNSWPLPVRYSGTFYGNGDAFREWLVSNKGSDIVVSTGSNSTVKIDYTKPPTPKDTDNDNDGLTPCRRRCGREFLRYLQILHLLQWKVYLLESGDLIGRIKN